MSAMFTLNDAAKALGISRRLLDTLVAEGRIRKLYLHPPKGSPRISQRELDAFMAARESRRVA